MNKDSGNLAVFWDEDIVGWITSNRNGNIIFRYSSKWLELRKNPISLSLPLQEEFFDVRQSTTFFENLLPEERIYRELCREAGLAEGDTYGFLKYYGRECAGALRIVPEESCSQERCTQEYRDITEDLEEILAQKESFSSNLFLETKSRLSLAGAQNKLPVLWKKGRFFVPAENSFAPTNAILKPMSSIFPDLHRNELFCMELAYEIGLNTPYAEILQIGNHHIYIIERYDRQNNFINMKRIHQEDFCQALGISRHKKYQENGGPGYTECTKLLLHPRVAANNTDRESFIRCAIFNYIIGNCDAHAKNYSLLYESSGRPKLAPFYDLVSTRIYPNLEQKFAMSFGKIYRFDRINDKSWEDFASDNNIRTERLYELIDDVYTSVEKNIKSQISLHENTYGASPVYEKLLNITEEAMKKLEYIIDPPLSSSPK